MGYLMVAQAAEKRGISNSRVRRLCANGEIDSNGHTGRLILGLELIRNGCPAINVKFADRKQYYDAFDAYYRDGNADEMVRLIGEHVEGRYLSAL